MKRIGLWNGHGIHSGTAVLSSDSFRMEAIWLIVGAAASWTAAFPASFIHSCSNSHSSEFEAFPSVWRFPALPRIGPNSRPSRKTDTYLRPSGSLLFSSSNSSSYAFSNQALSSKPAPLSPLSMLIAAPTANSCEVTSFCLLFKISKLSRNLLCSESSPHSTSISSSGPSVSAHPFACSR